MPRAKSGLECVTVTSVYWYMRGPCICKGFLFLSIRNLNLTSRYTENMRGVKRHQLTTENFGFRCRCDKVDTTNKDAFRDRKQDPPTTPATKPNTSYVDRSNLFSARSQNRDMQKNQAQSSSTPFLAFLVMGSSSSSESSLSALRRLRPGVAGLAPLTLLAALLRGDGVGVVSRPFSAFPVDDLAGVVGADDAPLVKAFSLRRRCCTAYPVTSICVVRKLLHSKIQTYARL